MGKKKNPYVALSEEEVAEAEANEYYLQVGEEIAEYEGEVVFSKETGEHLYDELFNSLRHMVENGNQDDKQMAQMSLLRFKLHPLRIH